MADARDKSLPPFEHTFLPLRCSTCMSQCALAAAETCNVCYQSGSPRCPVCAPTRHICFTCGYPLCADCAVEKDGRLFCKRSSASGYDCSLNAVCTGRGCCDPRSRAPSKLLR
jgi:hypothetical protein